MLLLLLLFSALCTLLDSAVGEEGCSRSDQVVRQAVLIVTPFPNPLKVAGLPDEIWNLISSPNRWCHEACWGAVWPVPSEMSPCSLVPLVRNAACLLKVFPFIETVRRLSFHHLPPANPGQILMFDNYKYHT